MVKEFKNNKEWALILGGSSGLGLASAKKLAKHGLNIIVVHRNSRAQQNQIQAEFEEIKRQDVSFLSFNIDATNSEKRAKVIQEIESELVNQKIRVLVHSIAKGNLKPMHSDANQVLRNDDFQITINAMGVSLYDWFQALFQKQLFAKSARVIAFTSEGNTKPWKTYAAVSAAKVTLEAIIRNIALEFAKFGINANCIQAGVTDTSSLNLIPESVQIKKHTLKRNPMHRLTTPKDIANVVYLLSKDEAFWINGTIIKADGGESLQ